MNTLLQGFRVLCVAVSIGLLLPLVLPDVWAQTVTNASFFSSSITLDGDISDFFEPDGVTPKPGVCVGNDSAPPIAGITGSEGLGENPLSASSTKDGMPHPSGFNQRRILSAFNPNLHGGTIFIGIDLPGGTSSAANPNYQDGLVPNRQGPDGVRAIRPFDADGNGDPQTIGQDGLTPVFRCADPGASPLALDVIDCGQPESGGFTDAVTATDDPGNKERYAVAVVFGDDTVMLVELFQDNSTVAGGAGLRSLSIPIGLPFDVMANVDGASNVLGFDIELALTNVNASVAECARLVHVVAANSGSLQDGSNNGEDFNVMVCRYPGGQSRLTVVDPMRFNRQSGLFQEVVRVTNPNSTPLPAVRVLIQGLPPDVQVFNASGQSDGVPYVQVNRTLPSCEHADVTIEYYARNAQVPTRTFAVEPTTLLPQSNPSGTLQLTSSGRLLPDRTFLLEFDSLTNGTYFVQYGDDLVSWKTAVPSIRSRGGRVQWIDNGPPRTDSSPATQARRFYRLLLVSP
jgi:hypothetical protein